MAWIHGSLLVMAPVFGFLPAPTVDLPAPEVRRLCPAPAPEWLRYATCV